MINNGVVVNTASLGTDLETVTLSTSSLPAGLVDTITVNNVHDLAANPIAANSHTQFGYLTNSPCLKS